MAVICTKCRNYKETFDEYNGWRWRCRARYWATIIPECRMPYEIEEVIRKNECEFFSDKNDFN